jgi:A/G-specific adenine glycosylase
VQKLVPLLLKWFSSSARDLPWRRTRDPYAIWVSEIMLQQTQVKTVIPYWNRWMGELPAIEDLAHADAGKIHKLWEGLGYYTRVRNLQRAAQQIVAADVRRRNDSQLSSHPPGHLRDCTPSARFPNNYEDVLALPGIGRYTAGAICSIAFNQPKPILDGNVLRVLARIFGIKSDPREKPTNAQLWQLAEALVSHAARSPQPAARAPSRSRTRTKNEGNQNCSHLNQSLMELGALICTPRSPHCAACPVRKLCVARKENLQDQLPNLGKRPAAKERRFLAFVVERNGKHLVRQRPAGVLNAHLWEFPNVEVAAGEGRARLSFARRNATSKSRRARSESPCQRSDFHVMSAKPICTIKHSITRYRITLEAWRARLPKPSGKVAGRWLSVAQLRTLAFTSAHRKILNHLRGPRQPLPHMARRYPSAAN